MLKNIVDVKREYGSQGEPWNCTVVLLHYLLHDWTALLQIDKASRLEKEKIP